MPTFRDTCGPDRALNFRLLRLVPFSISLFQKYSAWSRPDRLLSRVYRMNFVQRLQAPASPAIESERQTFYPGTYDDPFTGDPRLEFDEAWHEAVEM